MSVQANSQKGDVLPVQRGYRQACGVARALDLVGERWALLVVRELLLGPKRFSDLQKALPAASPNAVSDRLRELTAAGVVRRQPLLPPGNSHVYQLTDWGRELEPVILGLGTWALAAPRDEEQAFLSVDSVMLTIRTYYVPSGASRASLRVELTDRGGKGVFGVWLTETGAEVDHQPPSDPDATVTTTAGTLVSALGRNSIQTLQEARSTMHGDIDALQRLIRGVQIPTPSV